jgi:TPR repeat protein
MRLVELTVVAASAVWLLGTGCAANTPHVTGPELEATEVAAEPDPDPDRLEDECDAGNAESCYYAAVLYSSDAEYAAREPRAPELFGAAVEGFEAGCDAQDERACAFLGLMAMAGHGLEQSRLRAVHYFERSCALGSAESCNLGGALLLLGPEAARHTERAVALFGRGCDAGNADSCQMLQTLPAKSEARSP